MEKGNKHNLLQMKGIVGMEKNIFLGISIDFAQTNWIWRIFFQISAIL